MSWKAYFRERTVRFDVETSGEVRSDADEKIAKHQQGFPLADFPKWKTYVSTQEKGMNMRDDFTTKLVYEL